MPAGSENYTCGTCKQRILTVHVDTGVTPMFLACRATPGCKGNMASMMYAAPPAELLHTFGMVPVFEWYMPSVKKQKKMSLSTQNHCNRGGLLLRGPRK